VEVGLAPLASTPMKKIFKKKIYNGMCELRDYEVKKYIERNTPVRIVIGDEYMDLSVAELKKGKVTNTQHSIINEGQTYKLIGWRWKGIPYRDPQISLFVDPSKLRQAMERNGVKL
jgi:hypothetical protein